MAGVYALKIEQGVEFKRTIRWLDEAGNPINMTGMSARMQIRTREKVLLAEPTVNVDAAAGTLTVSLTSEETEQLTFGTAVYDIEILQGSEVIKRLLQGIVLLDGEVTADGGSDV